MTYRAVKANSEQEQEENAQPKSLPPPPKESTIAATTNAGSECQVHEETSPSISEASVTTASTEVESGAVIEPNQNAVDISEKGVSIFGQRCLHDNDVAVVLGTEALKTDNDVQLLQPCEDIPPEDKT